MTKHLHIFETSLVIYAIETDSPDMDWTTFFMKILPSGGLLGSKGLITAVKQIKRVDTVEERNGKNSSG